MSALTSSPTLLTAEEAQRKIEFIQAELLRVQRACEYRDEHPYDPAASAATAATHAVTRRAASAGDAAATSRTPKHLVSNGGGVPSRGSGSGGPARSHLSFSEFERRRIAQLLGRVGVEIAAVWAHVHQWSAVAETGAASLSATPTLTTPSSTPVHTARGPARQSSERSVATAAPPSDHGHARQSPFLPSCLKGRASGGTATGDGDALGDVNPNSTAARTAAAEEPKEAESTVSPAAQFAALNTLIRTALAIQQMLGGGGGGDAGRLPPQRALTGDSRFDGAEAAADLADVSASATLQEESEATAPPPPSNTELNRTLPASTSITPVPMLHDSPLQEDMCPPSATPSPAGGQRVAIPAYLKAYVLEASDKASPQSSEAEQGTADDDDDATVVVVNLDRGDSRSVSAGSVTGTNPRSFSRVSDAAAPSHTEGSSLHHGSEQTSSSPARSGPSVTAAVPSTALHHRFDSEVGFTTPSSPFKRVVSGSSLRSSSLIGSPVQALQQSHTRSQGYSTGSLQSQPLHVGGASHHNGSSSAGRSPDSAEMSPAAAAAYSRSTSLLRRPHRLEVPISRTQSLRRVPSYTSPTSLASSSPPSGAAAAVNSGAESSAFYSHAHAPSQQAGRGSGSVGGSYLSAHSAPLGVSTSVAVDSPHSSMTGLHFQRVISVDSENGGWPPGSLADSLEMSQPRAANHGSRPVPHAYSVNVAPSPAPQEMAVWELPRNFKAVVGGKEQPQLEGAQLQSSSGGTPSGAVSSPDNVGAASTISSALLGSYLAPGRGGDSLRSVSVHSRNLTPHYASVSSVSAYGRTPAPPPPPARSSMQQSNATRTTRSGAAVAHQTNRLGTPATTTTTTSSAGFAKNAETLALPPRSYHIDANKLSDFLQCVHGLLQMEFSEEEFDSMHLFYFLPGVSLARDTHASHATAPTEEGGGGSANLSTSSFPRSAHDDVPLPLFHGGDRIPVQLTKLDVFYSLVRRKVQEVCDNVGIPSESFLSLM